MLAETPETGRRELLRAGRAVTRRSPAAQALPPPTGDVAETLLPASVGQERLWFLDRLAPGTSLYNVALAVELRGALDSAALRGALQAIIDRHETLRSTLVFRDGILHQRVAGSLVVELPVDDLTGIDAEERERRGAARRGQEALRPFDLERHPPFRCRLVRLAPDRHTLLLTIHHSAVDGWSLRTFCAELGFLYAALRSGRPAALAPLPIQYGDFAAWQRRRLAAGAFDDDLRFWVEQLRGAELVLELPFGRPRDRTFSRAGAAHAFEIAADAAEGLRRCAAAERTTLYVVGLAAFAALIHRHAARDDFLVGTQAAGRTRPELENVIGFFLNTLALRFRLDDGTTFRQLVRQTREISLAALAHQELPFERVVEALNPQRDPTRMPVVQVCFVLHQGELSLELEGLRARVALVATPTAKFDLTLFVSERSDGGLDGLVEYNTSLFDASPIEWLARRYAALAAWASSHPHRPLVEAPLLDESERRAVLELSGGTALARRAASAVELLDRAERSAPHAPALCWEGRRTSYRELHARAAAVARALGAHGVGRGRRVAICASRGPALVIGVLGILEAGAAYVPLDPALPPTRREHYLRDAAVAAVVADDEHAESFRGTAARVVVVDPEERLEPEEALATPPRPEDPAYVIYTSGSTGAPKGVEVTQGNLAHYVEGVVARLGLRHGLSYAMLSPLWTDLGNTVLFGALATGGELVIVPDDVAPYADELAAFLARRQVDVAKMVPSQLAALLACDPAGRFLPRERLVLGGETFGWGLWEQLAAAHPSCRVFNHYGPTETTVGATCGECTGRSVLTRSVSIGPPLPNVRAYVLDERLRPVPLGIPGELYIGGDGVAHGYVGAPELTAQGFVPSPFEPGERLYRTGDRVRLLEDGSLEFLGRLDRQVKLRGFRVEPEEVEAALLRCPGVQHAAVVPASLDSATALVAYVASAPQTADALRRALRCELPEFMLPTRIIFLDRVPLTPTGKVDHRALPQLEPTPSAPPPVSEDGLEDEVLAIWHDVLGAGHVERDDDFFDVGGNSLLAVRLALALKAHYGVDVPLRMLFQLRTVSTQSAALADLIRRRELSAYRR